VILEQEGAIGHTVMVCLSILSASGALLISKGALLYWIEDLGWKLIQSPVSRPIEAREAGLELPYPRCICHAIIDELWVSHADSHCQAWAEPYV